MLTDAALEGKTDRLLGLKENVIIGKLIPAATGLRRYRRLEIEPTEPIRAPHAGGDRPARRVRAGGRARPDRVGRARGLRVRERRRRRGAFGDLADLADARSATDRTTPSAGSSAQRSSTARRARRSVPTGGLGSHQQRGGLAAGRPTLALLVEVVVDPGGRPVAGVLVDRVELPVGGAEHGAAVEGEARAGRGTAAPAGRAGARWPAPPSRWPTPARSARPAEPGAARVSRDAVGDAVDPVEGAREVSDAGAKPNRLITPSTSTKRTALLVALSPRCELVS